MAKSLAKIKEQIARLQREAESIQSTVIARIKREIAQHGLTAEHLFGSTGSTFIGNGNKVTVQSRKTASAKKAGSAKPAKYADDHGNVWHGIGKRPQWIHAALSAGHTLTDFLVGTKKAAPAATAPSATARSPRKATKKTARKAAGKVTLAKKAAPARNAVKASPGTGPARKNPAKKKSVAVTKRKAAVKKAPKVRLAAASADASQVPT